MNDQHLVAYNPKWHNKELEWIEPISFHQFYGHVEKLLNAVKEQP
jgi:hypothetical protein